MAQRSFLKVVGVIENMSAFTCEHGETYALFGSGGGQALAEAIGAPLLGQVPLEASVAAGGDTGEPVALAGVGAAADAFRAIAERILTDVARPADPDAVDMAGCSARLFDTVNAAFADLDAKA
jgi:ATP-binding protein involved in chromosome partitioning